MFSPSIEWFLGQDQQVIGTARELVRNITPRQARSPFRLLARERRIEAEALIENVKARIRHSQPQEAAASGSHADQEDEHVASSAQSSAPR